jgi:hypothetical protein
MSKSFFGIVVGRSESVNVMGDLVNKNVVEVESSEIVDVTVAGLAEKVGAKKDARAPVNAVAIKRTGPATLLLASAAE